MELLTSLNWLGILIAGSLAFALGMLWYAPRVFGRTWLAALGKTPEQLGAMAPAMVAQAAYGFLLAMVAAMLQLVTASGSEFVIAIFILAVARFVGTYAVALFHNSDHRLPMIDGGFQVAMVIVLGLSLYFSECLAILVLR